MVSGTRYKSHSWVTVTPREKAQSTTDFKPVNDTETKHSKYFFLLVDKETQCDPILADCFQLPARSTGSATGFSVISGESWSQWQKNYRLVHSGEELEACRVSSFLHKGGRANKSTGHFNRCWSLKNRGLWPSLGKFMPSIAGELHSRWLRSSLQEPSLRVSLFFTSIGFIIKLVGRR